tara:strand:+ start:549 stop:866 length:318 start_codon:yes stop_codon:yes gene_type:complete
MQKMQEKMSYMQILQEKCAKCKKCRKIMPSADFAGKSCLVQKMQDLIPSSIKSDVDFNIRRSAQNFKNPKIGFIPIKYLNLVDLVFPIVFAVFWMFITYALFQGF